MTNCPNCGAPVEPYSYRCPYCHTYYWDLDSWDIDDGTPCYIKFKMNGKVITALARPHIETIETSEDQVYATDRYGASIISYLTNRTCNINVNFECCSNKGNHELFRIEMGG